MCVYVYTHICILNLYIYKNIDKTNIYNLSVCGSIFICGSLYSSAWACVDNSPEASALTFFLVAFKCLLPCLNQNVLWENGRLW